jgi:hypothetical protein
LVDRGEGSDGLIQEPVSTPRLSARNWLPLGVEFLDFLGRYADTDYHVDSSNTLIIYGYVGQEAIREWPGLFVNLIDSRMGWSIYTRRLEYYYLIKRPELLFPSYDLEFTIREKEHSP